MKKVGMQFLLALCVAIGFADNEAMAEEKIVIRFSHVTAESTPKGKAALEFKRLAEKRTKGRVEVQVFANASLYKDKEELEALQLGAVQMLAPSLAKFGLLGIQDFEVFDLPYIFPNKQVLRAVTEGEIGKQLLKQLESRGILGLAYWDNGFKVFSSNAALRLPEDLQGKRVRIQPSRTLEAQMEALGATPIPMAFSEVYGALKSGLIDATENPPSNLFSKQMHTVQSHVVNTNHGYLGYAVIVNKKFWDNLPEDIRRTLEKCLQEATNSNNAAAEAINAKALANVKSDPDTTVIELTPAELNVWKNKLIPVQRRMEGRISKDLINRIKAVAANYPTTAN